MYLGLRIAGFELRVSINEHDMMEGFRMWRWHLRIGKWQRAEGVQYNVDGELCHVQYFEEKNNKRTTWGMRAPFYKYGG